MMRNRSWLAGLASKIFPRRFAAAKRAARRRPGASLRSFSDAPLASETLEPRYLLSGLSLVSVAMIDQGNETDGSPTIFEFTRSQETSSELSANILLQGTAQANVDYTAPVELGANNTLSVTFAAGSNTAQINLPTLADSVMDAGETILAIVQPGSGYAIRPGGDRATAIIEAEGVAAEAVATSYPGKSTGEHQNSRAFAALRADGSVVTWGSSSYGGDSSAATGELTSGVVQIFSTQSAFAALKEDGSVVTWGNSSYGGDSSAATGELTSGVVQIFSTQSAFAALKGDGSVVTWGSSSYGGDSSAVEDQLGSGVVQIFSTQSAFAALKADGSVVTWGSSSYGGDSSAVEDQLSSGVVQIFSNHYAFAALKGDGSVVTWGENWAGGDSSGTGEQLNSGILQIFSTESAFAALKENGSVVTWGANWAGSDSSAVASDLTSGVTQIFSTQSAFAALKGDGSVVTWGENWAGGDSSGTGEQLNSGIVQIFSTESAFAALKENGSVVTWGANWAGSDSSAVASDLTSGVTQIFSNHYAFAALKGDGSVVTWGENWAGGDSSGTGEQLNSGVVQIFSTENAFAALKGNGSVVTWGDSSYGGDSSGVQGDLLAVVGFANPASDERLTRFRPLITSMAPSFGALLHYTEAATDATISIATSPVADGRGVTLTLADETYTGTVTSNMASVTIPAGDLQALIPGTTYTIVGTVDDGEGNAGPARLLSFTVEGVAVSTTAVGRELDGSETVFTFSRGGDVSSELTIDVLLRGTALAGVDYAAPAGLDANNTLSVTFAAGSNTAQINLPTLADSVMDAGETILAIVQPGSGYALSPGGDRATAIIEAEGVAAEAVATSYPGKSTGEHQNSRAFAALRADGSVVTWGSSSYGGDSSAATGELTSGVVQIFSTQSAFAALKEDGSVVTWGNSSYGGDSSAATGELTSGVVQIFSTESAFAALKGDGSVVTWGSSSYGGDSSAATGELTSGVVQIFSNHYAFAALKRDGSVVTWGYDEEGGDSSAVEDQLGSGVVQIFSTESAFAALKGDGSVLTWGHSSYGGNSSGTGEHLNSGVVQIFSTENAFAALKGDGSVVTWGDSSYGGDSSAATGELTSGVTQIFSNHYAFAALKEDGSVVTWGDDGDGGESTAVASDLTSGVVQIFSTQSAFAALKEDGSVVTWGDSSYGGDSSAATGELTSGVVQIFSNHYAFAALKGDGSVVTWGSESWGSEYSRSDSGGDSSGTGEQLNSGVVQIFSTENAFAALKGNGSVVTWGDSSYGGDSSGVQGDLLAVVGFANPASDERLTRFRPLITSMAPSFGALLHYTEAATDATISIATSPVADGRGVTLTLADETYTGTVTSNMASVTIPAGDLQALIPGTTYTIVGTVDDGEGNAGPARLLSFTVEGVAVSTTAVGRELDGSETVFTFSRGGDVSSELTIDVLLRGTALAGVDYAAPAGLDANNTLSVTFAASSNTAQINLPTLADSVMDAGETILAIVQPGSGYALSPGGDRATAIIEAEGVAVEAVATFYPGKSTGEHQNSRAFAALRADGSVVTWGDSSYGGDSSAVASDLTSGVTQIFSTQSAFAALKGDGSVVTWGENWAGGDSSGTGEQLNSGIVQIFSTESAFAALKENGSVVTWGENWAGGDSSGTGEQLNSGVVQIFSNHYAFAALKADGSVVTWGSSSYGGDSSAATGELTSGVVQIFSTRRAFAALKGDGSVLTWGHSSYGGNSSGTGEHLNSGVVQIFSTENAFAALKGDGSVVTWGDSSYGGDSSAATGELTSGVTQIFSNHYAFAALKEDGSVVTWGDDGDGGESTAVASDLTSGVVQIFSTQSAFAALKEDGSVVTWGDSSYGGDSSAATGELTSGVVQIFSNHYAFAALKEDGSVVTWGNSSSGGNSSGTGEQLNSGVVQIFSTESAFAALKGDGSVVTWGSSSYGGDSSGVQDDLFAVVGIASPFTDARLTAFSDLSGPDLRVSAISAPVDALQGTAVSVSWTVSNESETEATGTWSDTILLSDDPLIGGDQVLGSFSYTGTLAAGESLQRFQTVTLPSEALGEQYLVVHADASGQVAEVNNYNNATISDTPIAISAPPLPNLQVTTVATPYTTTGQSVFSGQEMVVEWEVTNTGNAPTTAPVWWDRIWLSVDTVLDSNDDTYLGKVKNPSYLGVGHGYTSSRSVRLPNGIAGDYYILVATDADGHVTENSGEHESDNLQAGALRVELTPPPDLQVVSVIPGTAFSGQTMTVSYTLTNAGTGNIVATYWENDIYMSADDVIDENDILLGTDLGGPGSSGIKFPGGSATSTHNVQLPIGVSGDFYFLVRTDRSNQVYEHDQEHNNDGASGLTEVILTPPPDLVVTAMDVPNGASASRELEISYEVHNLGSTPTPQWIWTDKIYLSTESILDTETAVVLGNVSQFGQLGTNPPGDSYERTVSFTLPDALEGDYYVHVLADAFNAVYEFDEDNNSGNELITIHSQTADLTITDFVAPSQGEAGEAITIDWTIINQGAGDTAVTAWTDSLILSPDAVLGNADDINLGIFSRMGLLDVDQTRTRSEVVPLPFALEGDYKLFMVTDTYNHVYEGLAENNNQTAAHDIFISRQNPDLQVDAVTADSAAASGETFSVNWTVSNHGSGRTPVDYWHDSLYLSADHLFDASDLFLGNYYHTGSLDPGAEYEQAASITLPIDLAGDYYVLVRTDGSDAVPEAEESNNDGAAVDALNISLSDVPDLLLHNLVAPQSAISGQAIDLSWTTTNQGSQTFAHWIDTLYLSRDTVFDANTDISLGYRWQNFGAQAGSSDLAATGSFDIPHGLSGEFYVIGVADSRNDIYERGAEQNNVISRSDATQVELLSQSDLVVTAANISFESNSVPLPVAGVEYTVENQGDYTARGYWTDAFYLSADTQWDSSDQLIKRSHSYHQLDSGQSYTDSVYAELSGEMPGDYYVIVRSDIHNRIPESDETNNQSASQNQANLSYQPLAIGTAFETAPQNSGELRWLLSQGRLLYWQIDVAEGESLKISLDNHYLTDNELYIRYEAMPSRTAYDYRSPLGHSDNPNLHRSAPTLVVPTTQAGSYYLLAYCSKDYDYVHYTPNTPNEFSLLAEYLPFALDSVQTDAAGNSGPVTLEIHGSRLTEGTTFQLIDPDNNVVEAIRQITPDGATAYATFDLEEAPEVWLDLNGDGIQDEAVPYDLQATRASGEMVALTDALAVGRGQGAVVAVTLTGPGVVRPDRNYLYQVNYTNAGDVDAQMPLLMLTSENQTPMGLDLDLLTFSGSMQLLGSSGGYSETLRPGETVRIPIYYRSSTEFVDFHVEAITSENSDPADWDLISESARPPDIATAEWERFWGRIQPRLGNTWGDYVALLNKLYAEFATADEPLYDVRELFARLHAANPDYLPHSMVTGSIKIPGSQTGEWVALGGGEIVAYQQQDGTYYLAGAAVADSEGYFQLPVPVAGNYELALGDGYAFDQDQDGGFDLEPLSITVLDSADLEDVAVYALDTSGSEDDSADSQPRLIQDAAGVSHLFWIRDGELWHSIFNNGGWESGYVVPQVDGRDISVAATENIAGGSEPGLVVSWSGVELIDPESDLEAGPSPSKSNIFYVVGRQTASGYAWSDPVALSDDLITDQEVEIAFDATGKLIAVYQKFNSDIADDSDLYFNLLDLDSADLSWPAASPATAALFTNGGLQGDFSLNLEKEYEVPATGIFNSWYLGGAKFKYSLKGEFAAGCDQLKASLGGGITFTLPPKHRNSAVEISYTGDGKYEGTWVENKKNCEWKFKESTLEVSGSGKLALKKPLGELLGSVMPPQIGFATEAAFLVLEYVYGIESNAILSISPKLSVAGTWTQAPAPPVEFRRPDKGSVGFSLSGGVDAELKKQGGWEAKLYATLAAQAELHPNFKFNGWSFDIGYEQKEGNFVDKIHWSYTYPESPTPSGFSLLNQTDPGTLVLEFYYEEQTGSDADYAAGMTESIDGAVASVKANVETDLLDDTSPSIATSPTGETWMSWTRALDPTDPLVDPTDTLEGTEILVSRWNGSAWGTPVSLPRSRGLSGLSALAFDTDGNPLVTWAMADSSSLSDLSERDDLNAVRLAQDIHYSHYDGQGWSEAARIAVLEGMDFAAGLDAGAGDERIATWTNSAGDTAPQTLYASIWNGSGWGAAQEIATGQFVGAASSGVVAGQSTVFWTLDVDSDPQVSDTRIYSRSYQDGNWSQTTPFDPALVAVATASPALLGPLQGASGPLQTASDSSLLPPTPKEQGCFCDEDEDEEDSGSGGGGGGGGGGNNNQQDDSDSPNEDDYEPPVIRPVDPNDILGPEGFGEEGWVPADDTFHYTIRFENDSQAAAPAQEVVITQQLDEDLDWRTFRVDDFGWGELYFDASGELPYHNQRLDLTAEHGFYVDVAATVDVGEGLITWTLKTIDPQTGEAPLDALLGFLPPNDEDGSGEGFVSYQIRAKSTAVTGDVVDAVATIVFDTEAPIDTPPIFNTLDSAAPTTSMQQFEALIDQERFLVQWEGQDDPNGSGLTSYNVAVSENGHAFTPWLERTTLTAAEYDGTAGHRYAFYVTAIDNAGNLQPVPASAQAETHIDGGTATLGNFVWHDRNGDGIQDDNEPGVSQVTVQLLDDSESLQGVTVTNSYGFYTLSDIQPGNYHLEFTPPANVLFSPQDQGTDESLDSDVDPLTGKTDSFTVEGGAHYTNWDVGLHEQPVFDDQTFDIPENSVAGTVIGTLAATYAHGSPLSYSIPENSDPDLDGNNAFRLEGNQLLVNDPDDLDHESNPQLVIIAETQFGSLSDSAEITVVVSNVNEAPVITSSSSVAVAENTTSVIALASTDPDASDHATFAITGGADAAAFRIETEMVSLSLIAMPNFEAPASAAGTNTYELEVTVSDEGGLSDLQNITVAIINVEEIPVITLLGASPLVLEASDTENYSDPGTTVTDPEDGDLSGSVQVSGDSVDLSVPGTYIVRYDCEDLAGNPAEQVTRTVVVEDTTCPEVTLVGENSIFVEAGFPYTDAGATAEDSLDGDVTEDVEVTVTYTDENGNEIEIGQVETQYPRLYTLRYDVEDAAGNAADQVARSVTVKDTLRPVIALTYSGEVLQVSDHSDTGLGGEVNAPSGVPTETELNAVGSAVRLNAPIIRSTDFTQPGGSPVESRQEWTAIEPAGSVSEIPAAAAWDHVDTDLAATTTIGYIDDDGAAVDMVVSEVDFSRRGTYLFEYDAHDGSGNYAEQVVFGLILNDTIAPVISVTGGASETIEAGSVWTLLEATAADNIDGDRTADILYTVENVSMGTLGSELTHAEAAALFDTTRVGEYLVTMTVSDAAGIYGHNSSNNTAVAYKAITIRDTLKPVITLTGDAVIHFTETLGGTYGDPGATAYDSFDGDLTNSIVLSGDVVDLEQAGTYVLTYNVSDAAGNAADRVTRTIYVSPGLSQISITAAAAGDESDGSPVEFALTRTGDTAGPLTVNVSLAGTAAAGSDYLATGIEADGTLAISFAEGVAETNVILPVLADEVFDPHETIVAVVHSGVGYVPAAGHDRATAIIASDLLASDPLPRIYSGNQSGEQRNRGAFAAIRSDGSVVTWGHDFYGGDSSSVADQLESGVTQIFSNCFAFAAVKTNGSVVAWGHNQLGGDITSVAAVLVDGVDRIYSTYGAFAALKSDGSVVTWGRSTYGGDSSHVADLLRGGVTEIYSNRYAFAALKNDGSVVTWGADGYGGDSSSVLGNLNNVRTIVSTGYAFAALRDDGDVVCWGYSQYGGDDPGGLGNVVQLYANAYAFAALREDGTIASWGHADFGGTSPEELSGATHIVASDRAFAALVGAEGLVASWGDVESGGTAPESLLNATQLFAAKRAFAALRNDGSVVTWGDSNHGGDSSMVSAELSGEVTRIYSTDLAFAALKSGGSVVTWGSDLHGGDRKGVSGLEGGVVELFTTSSAFAALGSDGSVVSWGNSNSGGTGAPMDSGYVAFANPLTDDRLLAFNAVNAPPLLADQSFSVAENSIAGTAVGTLAATDPEGDSLSYSITAGVDPDGDGYEAFRIEGDQLLVHDPDDLNYETAPQLIIAVEVSDGSLHDTAQITVNLIDAETSLVTILDNGESGFSQTGFRHQKNSQVAAAYGGDNHNMWNGTSGKATWTFDGLAVGEYQVAATWDHKYSNRYNAPDAPFTITNDSGTVLASAIVNQKNTPSGFASEGYHWDTLGTVHITDGILVVTLGASAISNTYSVADAVRIEMNPYPASRLLVILEDSSVSEAGSTRGKVIRTGDTAGSLTVNLASDNAAAATVPASITLGEGARYGTFTITPTDDSAPDGTQIANIGATAAGFTAGTAALDVVDDDATILFVDNGEDGFVADAGFKRRNVAGAYQNDNHYMRGGTGEASWTFTGLEEGQYFVSTTWNHIWDNRYNTERAPFSIRNGSGNLLSTLIVDQTQTPADFTDGGYGWEALAPVYINDGTLIVTLGASPTNHHAVADAIRIELNESLAPSLFVLVDTLSESAGASTGTVVRTGDVSSEATVGLTSSNPDAATVESSITFAIGESTKSFAVTPTDDSSPDGIQQSTIEATAASYAAGTAVLNVQDDDAMEVAIMDNTDSGYTSNGFRYNANKQVSDAYGGNNESLKGGEPGEEASWTFTGLTDGVYHVSATWNHQYNNNYNATDAQYSITNAGDEALATTTINQSNAPSEFLDNGIAWGTLETVTVTGGELIVTVSGGSNQNRHTVADAVRIARVAELGGASMRMAEADPFYDPLEDSLDDLASEWSGASEEEDQLVWGE